MNKETRIKKIAEILQGEPFGTQEIPWQDELEQMNVYKVPLEYLIYNVLSDYPWAFSPRL